MSLVSEDKGKVNSSANVGFDPDTTLRQTSGLDFLFLLSAPTNTFELQTTPAHLRTLFRHGVTLGAISGGVFPLMRAGLSTKTPISVHWCYRSAFDAEFPKITASDQVVEIQNRLITASGQLPHSNLPCILLKPDYPLALQQKWRTGFNTQ